MFYLILPQPPEGGFGWRILPRFAKSPLGECEASTWSIRGKSGLLSIASKAFHILVFPFKEAFVGPIQPLIAGKGKGKPRDNHKPITGFFPKQGSNAHY